MTPSPNCLVFDKQEMARLFAGLGEDRKQNGGKNRDDGDDDEQLNERKTTSSAWHNSFSFDYAKH
jgi:hypothetical protein